MGVNDHDGGGLALLRRGRHTRRLKLTRGCEAYIDAGTYHYTPRTRGSRDSYVPIHTHIHTLIEGEGAESHRHVRMIAGRLYVKVFLRVRYVLPSVLMDVWRQTTCGQFRAHRGTVFRVIKQSRARILHGVGSCRGLEISTRPP